MQEGLVNTFWVIQHGCWSMAMTSSILDTFGSAFHMLQLRSVQTRSDKACGLESLTEHALLWLSCRAAVLLLACIVLHHKLSLVLIPIAHNFQAQDHHRALSWSLAFSRSSACRTVLSADLPKQNWHHQRWRALSIPPWPPWCQLFWQRSTAVAAAPVVASRWNRSSL